MQRRELIVAQRDGGVVGGEHVGEMCTDGSLRRNRRGDALKAAKCRLAVEGSAQQHITKPDGGDVAVREVVEPRVEKLLVRGGALHGSAVANPQCGVFGGVELLALDHPGVERNGGVFDPGPHAVEAVGTPAVLPVAQKLRDAAGCEVLADAREHRRDEGIALHAAIAVFVRGYVVAARRDDKRRVRHDAIKRFASHRLKQAAGAHINVGDAVEECVESGEGEGVLGDIGGDNALGMPTRAQGLNAASGAEVEDAACGGRNLQCGERERCAADTHDVVIGERAAERRLVKVARDPPFPGPGFIDEGLRPDEHSGRADVRPCDEAEGVQTIEAERRQRGGQVGARLCDAEHEEPCKHGGGIGAVLQRTQRGHPGSAGESVVGGDAPRRANALRGESRIAQVGGEGGD